MDGRVKSRMGGGGGEDEATAGPHGVGGGDEAAAGVQGVDGQIRDGVDGG